MRYANTLLTLSIAAFLVSSCATAPAMIKKQRGLEPTEVNDGGLRQAPPPPEDGETSETAPGI